MTQNNAVNVVLTLNCHFIKHVLMESISSTKNETKSKGKKWPHSEKTTKKKIKKTKRNVKHTAYGCLRHSIHVADECMFENLDTRIGKR